jgi:hypothetical protein
MALLRRGRFQLHKICSGHRSILEVVLPVDTEFVGSIELDRDEAIKTLGLQWNPLSQSFPFIK